METDYNRIQTLGIPDGLQDEGEVCPDCDMDAVELECCMCGIGGYVINCGHYAQPRPIAAGRHGGLDMHQTYCCDCAGNR